LKRRSRGIVEKAGLSFNLEDYLKAIIGLMKAEKDILKMYWPYRFLYNNRVFAPGNTNSFTSI